MAFCIPKKQSEPDPDSTLDYQSIFTIKKCYLINNNSLVLNGQKPLVELRKMWSNEKTTTFVMVDSIYFNSIPLKITQSPYYTICNSDTISQNTLPPFIWRAANLSEFPTFTISISDSIPRLSSYNTLPDSISASKTSLIYIEGANASDVEIIIEKSNGELCWAIYRPINNSTAMVYTPNNLAVLNTATLIINFKKGFYKTIDEKEVFFSLIASYSKQIKIVP
ncbi:MAG: hypothetical protein Q7W45_08390 [Bacteroidota bacterium]|nr:hypothetical protein [Bacteroidota bacterium]MDP3146445.1 hypothetical protein [Bacteroidota bacterium]